MKKVSNKNNGTTGAVLGTLLLAMVNPTGAANFAQSYSSGREMAKQGEPGVLPSLGSA